MRFKLVIIFFILGCMFPDAPLFIWVILGMLGVLVSEGGK